MADDVHTVEDLFCSVFWPGKRLSWRVLNESGMLGLKSGCSDGGKAS